MEARKFNPKTEDFLFCQNSVKTENEESQQKIEPFENMEEETLILQPKIQPKTVINRYGKTTSIGIFIKIQWANFDELILFNCWLLNMFFPFSSVSNQTYLLRQNRYQLTVFDRLNSYENLIKKP